MNQISMSKLDFGGYMEAIRLSERERIIRVLQPLAQHSELCEGGCYPEDCSAFAYEYAIGLIKGEQK